MHFPNLFLRLIVVSRHVIFRAQILERQTAKEVLHAILHAILFHRLFGTVKPQTFDVLDVTMVSASTTISSHTSTGVPVETPSCLSLPCFVLVRWNVILTSTFGFLGSDHTNRDDTAWRRRSGNGTTRQREGRRVLESDREWIKQTWTGTVSHVAGRSGRISIIDLLRSSTSCAQCHGIDPGYLFGKETEKVVVSSVCRGRRRAMGTMVSLPLPSLVRS